MKNVDRKFFQTGLTTKQLLICDALNECSKMLCLCMELYYSHKYNRCRPFGPLYFYMIGTPLSFIVGAQHTCNRGVTHDTVQGWPDLTAKGQCGHAVSCTDMWAWHTPCSLWMWHCWDTRAACCNSRVFVASNTTFVGSELVSTQLCSTWKDKRAPGLNQCWLESGSMPTR